MVSYMRTALLQGGGFNVYKDFESSYQEHETYGWTLRRRRGIHNRSLLLNNNNRLRPSYGTKIQPMGSKRSRYKSHLGSGVEAFAVEARFCNGMRGQVTSLRLLPVCQYFEIEG